MPENRNLRASRDSLEPRIQRLSRSLQVKVSTLLSRITRRAQTYTDGVLSNYVVFLPRMPTSIRDYVDGSIVNALEILITKELWIDKTREAIGSHASNPICFSGLSGKHHKDTLIIDGYVAALERISKKGLLKVLLTAYLKLLPAVVQKSERSRTKGESVRMLKFVASLAALDKWSPADVYFSGELVHFVIVPIAARYPGAADFYKRRIEEYSRRREISAIFVLAIGFLNSIVAERAAECFCQIHSEEFILKIKDSYKVLRCLESAHEKESYEAQAVTAFIRRRKLESLMH